MTAIEKENALIAWLVRRRRVAIGFSGGVDSSYLAAVMVEALGRDHAIHMPQSGRINIAGLKAGDAERLARALAALG